MTIDALAYNSKLAGFSPNSKMAFGLVPLILCLCWNSFLVSVFVILLMSAISIFLGGIPVSKYIKLVRIPAGFLLLGTITIIVGRWTVGTRMLLGITAGGWAYGITSESLRFGAAIILRAMGAICSMYFISLSTPMNDLLAALRTMRIPLLLVSLMELIYRYIFVFLDEAERMRTAQDSRLGYINLKTGLKSTGQLLASLFLRVYLRCDRSYAALESRGYTGEFKTLPRTYLPSGNIYLSLIPAVIFLSVLGILEKLFIK